MPDAALLRDLLLAYALALVLIVVLARARVPAIVAMIAAGALAGPAGLGIIHTEQEVESLAEIGVVLLLFTVGLEFSLAEVRRIWRLVLGGGLLQMTGTAVAVLLLLELMDVSLRLALFIGLFVALSSTAIVLKGLGERNQLGAPHGRLSTGILLLQDLAIVLLLLLVPILAGTTSIDAAPVVMARALAALALVALVSRLVLPPLLRLVAASGRREAFPLAILLASVGTAWMASLLGVSMALGAFLGGLVLAESEFSHQAHAEVRPLRDLLAGLFFISLGMLIDFTVVIDHLPVVAVAAAAIVIVKSLVATGSVLAVGTPLRVAVATGVGLAQVGEFSFILGRSGVEANLLTADVWQVLLSASIVTMVLTPALLEAAPVVAAWVSTRRRRVYPETGHGGIPHVTGHVIVLGFGLGGQLVARVLKELGTPYVVLELNGATIRSARAAGEPVFYGDAANPDSLRAAGVTDARALVAVLSDPEATGRAVRTARQLAPALPILARTRYRTEAEALERAGAAVAVAEEIETSLEVVAQLLARVDVPGNLVSAMLDLLRRDSTTLRPMRAAAAPLDALPEDIRAAPIATHRMHGPDWGTGRTLAQINLRAETGASIIAVRRGDRSFTSPGADLALQDGDVLYLMGDESDVLLARQRLTAGT